MKDKFEQTIKKVSVSHPEKVPDDSWDEIRNNLKLKKSNKPSFNYWKIASILLFMSVIGLLYKLFFITVEAPKNGLSSISEHYQKIEAEYQATILQVSQKIDLNEVNRKAYVDIFKELETIDSLNSDYENDLNSIGKQEILVPILIDLYEKKIKLLKKLELEINRRKNEKYKQTSI